MFGCTDASQVLAELEEAKKAYPQKTMLISDAASTEKLQRKMKGCCNESARQDAGEYRMALFSPSKQQGCSHFTPGATRSGFRISNVRKLGPLDENAATIGEGRMPNFVPKKARVAVGRGLVRAYCLIIFPAVAPTAIAGKRWLSATSSSPFSAVLANIMPTPPASFTTCPLCTLGVMPLSHITIFPVTTAGSMAPSRHMEVGSGLLELVPKYTNGFTTDGKSLSIVLAPTVVIHGDTFMRVIGSGPPFPAEQETNTPFSIAPKVATAKLSWLTNIDVNETDREGNSALHCCLKHCSNTKIPRIPFLLLKRGANILLLKDLDCVDAISETQEPAITFHVNPIPIPIHVFLLEEYYHLPRLSDPLKNCEREILKALTSLAEMVPVRLRICPCQVDGSYTAQNVKEMIEERGGNTYKVAKGSSTVCDIKIIVNLLVGLVDLIEVKFSEFLTKIDRHFGKELENEPKFLNNGDAGTFYCKSFNSVTIKESPTESAASSRAKATEAVKAPIERWFLYPIYLLICVAAAAVIESFPDFSRDKYAPNLTSLTMTAAKVVRHVVLGLILAASHCRTFSLIHDYSAPLEAYKHLEHHEDVGVASMVCVGSVWHRFPSAFFVPEYVGEVRWLDDGFRGLLPLPFNATLGGSVAAPPYFNNKNIASDEQYVNAYLNQFNFL
ncbi:hypothetical protein IFM89_026501 [Coptis chinensis]|uniref:Uncharacterized protein n=1 Tax=Coptis chinensis TaxID=261450 RepID=A0A835M9P0_9MAGN|nr:hypothetical protein IFM89_026501 [Coptis chinensis]